MRRGVSGLSVVCAYAAKRTHVPGLEEVGVESGAQIYQHMIDLAVFAYFASGE